MASWLGLLLLISGLLSLVFNEFTVQVRRIWPWRRDPDDPIRDEELDEYHRLTVYLGSIAAIELGAQLATFDLPHLLLRGAVYLSFGAWLLIRRPVLRSKAFWLSLPQRGRGCHPSIRLK